VPEGAEKRCLFYLNKKTMNTEIHIGRLIRAQLKEQRRSTQWLADQIPCHATNIDKIYHKQHLNSELLFHICMILHYNFFAHYADDFDKWEALQTTPQNG
jgi:hypothetical protein